MNRLRIDVWSDIACPWCYVGKRRLERALEAFPERASVDVIWRAFELDPAAPRTSAAGPYAPRLAKKYGMSEADAQRRIDQLVSLAKGDGLALDFERIRPGNTFDAHRVIHEALAHGRQNTVKERFLRAYLSEGEAIGDVEVVARLAVDAGLDRERVREVLGSDAHADAVRADEREAARLGIHGVPCFVFGGQFAVSGAQPVEMLGKALERAWSASRPLDFAEGAACGPDGC